MLPGALRRIVLLVAMPPMFAAAQIAVPQFQPHLQQVTPAVYRVQVRALRESSGDSFQVRWQWLRELLNTARNPAAPSRNTLLDQASARLDDELNQPAGQPSSSVDIVHARRTADAILNRPEFRIVGHQSWWDRELAEFYSWLGRIFSVTSSFGRRSPWLVPVLEWTFISLSVAGVLVWVVRTMQRQRVALSLGASLPAADWHKESAQWADLARAEAGDGNWREAIHCLYWASIVALESRRLWRRDYARTPREYLRLLDHNSPRHTELRALTSIFERIWYGLRPAAHSDYLQALALFEDLRRA
jgi:hypothetical protein